MQAARTEPHAASGTANTGRGREPRPPTPAPAASPGLGREPRAHAETGARPSVIVALPPWSSMMRCAAMMPEIVLMVVPVPGTV